MDWIRFAESALYELFTGSTNKNGKQFPSIFKGQKMFKATHSAQESMLLWFMNCPNTCNTSFCQFSMLPLFCKLLGKILWQLYFISVYLNKTKSLMIFSWKKKQYVGQRIFRLTCLKVFVSKQSCIVLLRSPGTGETWWRISIHQVM